MREVAARCGAYVPLWQGISAEYVRFTNRAAHMVFLVSLFTELPEILR